jgi:hypothetical protein
MAALRSDYARRGMDVSAMSDVDLLFKEWDMAEAEVSKLRVRNEERMAARRDDQRATRTAARGRYEDQIAAWDRLIFHCITRMSGGTVRAALYRAANLSSLASSSDISAMRDAASKALHLWDLDAQDMNEGAGRHEAVNVAESQRREIARLRKLIKDHAASIVSGHARSLGALQICKCAGCELARAMDDVEGSAKTASD